MKIGIDIRELEKDKFTGISRYLRQFLSFTAESDKQNEYILLGNQKTDYNIKADNQKLIIIPEKITFLWDQIKLPFHLKKQGVDVFLTPYFKAPLCKPTKMVVIINDIIPLVASQYQKLKYFFKRTYFRAMIKSAIKKADRIITISQHSKKDIVEFSGIDSTKIEIMTLAVDPYKLDRLKSEKVVGRYGVNDKFIFYFGNFNQHKNIKGLLTVYNKLPDYIKNHYKLVIGGKKNKHYSALVKLVKLLAIKNKVMFIDSISDEDLLCFYNAAQLFVFPSLYEGFGLPVLEAMACGTPVVAFNVTSIPEVTGDAAILVNPNDTNSLSKAIEKVLLNETLRNNLIAKGIERAKKFSVEKMARKILNVLNEAGRNENKR